MASHLEAGDVVTVSKTYIDENGKTQQLFKNQQARITEIKEEDGTFEITAKQYNPSIYDDTFGSSLKVFAPSEDNPNEINLIPNVVLPIKDLIITNRYSGIQNGVRYYDVRLKWTAPDDNNYWRAKVYYRSSLTPVRNIKIVKGKKTRDYNQPSEWNYIGSGFDNIVITSLVKGGDYEVKVVPVDSNGIEREESALIQSYRISENRTAPSRVENIKLKLADVAEISWDEVTNTDVDFYEVRTNKNYGSTDGLLLKSISNKNGITLTDRSGILYVFARNTVGIYSQASEYI